MESTCPVHCSTDELSTTLINEIQELESLKTENRSQRTNIFNEILHSETEYVCDLKTYQGAFSRYDGQLNFKPIIDHFRPLQNLAEKLIGELKHELGELGK